MNMQETAATESRQLATFRIGDELFGLGINNIREIVRYPAITGVPRSPSYLTGLANMRGNVLPVVDARLRLGVKVTPITDMTRVLVIEAGGTVTGLVVDRVCGVINLESASVETPPALLTSGVDTKYVKSVLKTNGGKKIIMEINAENLCLTEAGLAVAARQDAARKDARREDSTTAAEHELQLVTFLVAREEYAFPIESVREVLRIGAITEVPDEPPHILGILAVRNALLPVVDVRRLFGLPSLAESLHAELAEVAGYGEHVGAAFARHCATPSGTWSPDATAAAVSRYLDGLHSASDLLGRHYQAVRSLFQRLLATVRVDQRSKNALALMREAQENVNGLVEQIRLKVTECQKSLEHEIQEDQRILVIEIGTMPVGILVDRMNQVIRLPERSIDAPPPLLNSEKASSLKGIVKLDNGRRLIMLVDQNTMLHAPDLSELYNATCAGGEYGARHDPLDLDDGVSSDTVQLVTFRLGDEEYGISIDEVQEINRFEEITSVPRAPAFVEGVMNLRGNVIPAIDLRKRFGLETVSHDEATRVIIVTMSGKLTGLIVDSVSEVFRLQQQAIEAPPGVICGDESMEFIKGICKASHTERKMIVLLDVSRLLAQHEQQELKAVVANAAKHAEQPEPTVAPMPPVAQTAPSPVAQVAPVEIPAPVEPQARIIPDVAEVAEVADNSDVVEMTEVAEMAEAPRSAEAPAKPAGTFSLGGGFKLGAPSVPVSPQAPEVSEVSEISEITEAPEVQTTPAANTPALPEPEPAGTEPAHTESAFTAPEPVEAPAEQESPSPLAGGLLSGKKLKRAN